MDKETHNKNLKKRSIIMSDYPTFLEELKKTFEEFVSEAVKGEKRKASSLRARKLSLKLRKDLQSFRDVSLDNDKVITESKKDSE